MDTEITVSILQIFSLAFSSFAVGFSLCGCIAVGCFSRPKKRKNRDEQGSEANKK